MSVQYLKYDTAYPLAYITLNRPEKRNAFSYELVTALKTAFATAQEDEQVKIVILQAEGNVFCAGADLDYLQKLQYLSYEENLEDSTYLKELYWQIYRFPKVVIAAVQGHALAGGCGLITVCDFVFTVPDAKFGYTEVKIGFVPAIVMTFLLRKIGETRAKELLISGNLIGADKALAYNLVNEIVAPEDLHATVQQFALALCTQNSAQAMGSTKQMIADIQSMDLAEALQYAATSNATARGTTDCKKGIAAFLNKEKIVW